MNMKPIGVEGPQPVARPKSSPAKTQAKQPAQSPAAAPTLAPQEAVELKTKGKAQAPVVSLVDDTPQAAQTVAKAASGAGKAAAKTGQAAKAAPKTASTKAGRQVKVSAYGPGLYGNKTANGTVLRRETVGVAHKSLPLGSKVDITINGKTITAKVIDRGPYVGNRQYDLTEGLIKQFGYSSCSEFGVRTVTVKPH
jgi:rare lipoprotein A (peptidoglycan hydrolase)